MPIPSVGPPCQIDLTDRSNKIYQGSLWIQNFTYFAFPSYGQFVFEIQEIPSLGVYSGKVVNGQYLDSITPLDPLDTFTKGQFVIVENIYGLWKILNPAPLEDVSDVSRVYMEIRDRHSGVLVSELDSDDGDIELSPNVDVTFKVILLDAVTATMPSFRYSYDVFFYYGSLPDPVYKVKRQYGEVQVDPKISEAP
jgi:hypothetical protein